MRKLICMMLALLVCVSLALPAAAESVFIPSVGVTIKSATVNGNDVTSAFVSTTVPQAKDGSTDASQSDRDLLIAAYESMSAGNALMPFQKKYEFADMSMISFTDGQNSDLAEELKKDGSTVTMTLELGAAYVGHLSMVTYVDGKWIQVPNVKRNDDGTITCELENVGPIAFVQLDEEDPEETTPEEEKTETEKTETEKTVSEFVPSIGYKESPIIISATTNMVLSNGEALADKISDCLIATSVEQAMDNKTDITPEERERLISLYKQLSDGSMTLPLDKEHVIRDLIDVNFFNENCRQKPGHEEKVASLKEEGVTVTITFDLRLPYGTDVVAMSYIDGKWENVKDLTRNEDGSVTVVMEDVAPVAFAVQNANSTPGETPWTGDAAGNSMGLWIALMVICAAGVVVLVVLKKKKK